MKEMDRNSAMIFFLLWMLTTKHIVSGVNIALAKNTRQSTTYEPYCSEWAVDGDTADWRGDSFICAHTEKEYQPWWAVDLGDTYNITHVIVYNRKDAVSSRLSNYDIDVFAQPGCSSDKWITFSRGSQSRCHCQSSSVSILNATCQEESIGRFVRIRQRNTEYLNVCEIEVYGSLTSNPIGTSSSKKVCGFPRKDYNGHTLITTKARSNVECAGYCLKTEGCYAGVSEKSTNTCFLKGKMNIDENTQHSFFDNNTRTSWLI